MDSQVNQNGSDLAQLLMVATAGIGVPVQQMWRIKKLIDELPNECLVTILKKLTWRQLIHLRLVCKRWRAVVHSMGKLEKSLMLNLGWGIAPGGDGAFVKLKNRFFVGLNVHNFVVLNLNLKVLFNSYSNDRHKYLKTLIEEMFPSVEQLLIDVEWSKFIVDDILSLWPAQQITTLSLDLHCDFTELSSLSTHLNSFTSLKQLGFGGNCSPQILPMIEPTLARLEHISWNPFSNQMSAHEDFNQLARNLGPNCTRFLFKWEDFAATNVGQLGTISNPQIFGQLTHLNLKMFHTPRVDQLVRLICEKSTCLQVLCIMCTNLDSSADLSTPTLLMLAKLVHLVKLELFNINLDFASLEQASRERRLIPLSTVNECTIAIGHFSIVDIDIQPVNSDRFTRVLSAFMPNVESLHIGLVDNDETRASFLKQLAGLQLYWNRFPKLRERKFSKPYLNYSSDY